MTDVKNKTYNSSIFGLYLNVSSRRVLILFPLIILKISQLKSWVIDALDTKSKFLSGALNSLIHESGIGRGHYNVNYRLHHVKTDLFLTGHNKSYTWPTLKIDNLIFNHNTKNTRQVFYSRPPTSHVIKHLLQIFRLETAYINTKTSINCSVDGARHDNEEASGNNLGINNLITYD